MDEEYLNEVTTEIVDTTLYLSKTIDDFRDFIKGNKKLEIFDLNEILQINISLFKNSVKNHNISIVYDTEDFVMINGLIDC